MCVYLSVCASKYLYFCECVKSERYSSFNRRNIQ